MDERPTLLSGIPLPNYINWISYVAFLTGVFLHLVAFITVLSSRSSIAYLRMCSPNCLMHASF
jgi:hypothetical protein